MNLTPNMADFDYTDRTLNLFDGGIKYNECCPLVVNPLAYVGMLAFLAAAVYFLNEQIGMSMLMMPAGRRKRSAENSVWSIFDQGKTFWWFVFLLFLYF